MAVLLVLALLVLAPLAPRALVSRPMLRPVSRPRLRVSRPLLRAPQWAPLLIRSSCGGGTRAARHALDTGLPFAWPTVIRDVMGDE